MSGFIGTPKSQDLNIEKTLYIKKKTKKKNRKMLLMRFCMKKGWLYKTHRVGYIAVQKIDS